MDNRKRCDGVGALFCVLGEFAAKREFRQIELRGFFGGGGVDKIQTFRSFFVYFGTTQGLFGGGGRQNQGISLVSCLLRGPRNQQPSTHCICQKKQPKQSTAFFGTSGKCRAQKQDFSRRSPVNHLFFMRILAPEAEDESGNDRTDGNGKDVAERVVCKRRYPEAAVRCGNGYVPQSDESS